MCILRTFGGESKEKHRTQAVIRIRMNRCQFETSVLCFPFPQSSDLCLVPSTFVEQLSAMNFSCCWIRCSNLRFGERIKSSIETSFCSIILWVDPDIHQTKKFIMHHFLHSWSSYHRLMKNPKNQEKAKTHKARDKRFFLVYDRLSFCTCCMLSPEDFRHCSLHHHCHIL